jgi:hypothetical protein
MDATTARVNPEAGAATAWRGDPPTVALSPDGTIYVGWTARVGGSPHASALELSASRDGGRTFAPRKSFVERGASSTPTLIKGEDGSTAAVWEDQSTGSSRVVTASLDADARAARGGVLAGAGELPAAASASGRTFVAYTAGENGRRELWIVSAGWDARGGA